MKNKIFLVATMILTAGIILNSCKKGSDDPFLSLSSRDARITSIWKLTGYEKTTTRTNNTSTTVTEFTYDGTTMTKTKTDASGTVTTDTYSYSQEFDIQKNGTYVSTEVDNGESTVNNSNWWWLSSNKNKVGIVLELDGTFFVDRLASKELILSSDEFDSFTDADGIVDSTRTTLLMTFAKQK